LHRFRDIAGFVFMILYTHIPP